MATSPVEQWVADLWVARRRARHRRALVLELAAEGKTRAAVEELEAMCALEDEIDDYVQLLNQQFATGDDDQPDAEVVALPTIATPPVRRRR